MIRGNRLLLKVVHSELYKSVLNYSKRQLRLRMLEINEEKFIKHIPYVLKTGLFFHC